MKLLKFAYFRKILLEELHCTRYYKNFENFSFFFNGLLHFVSQKYNRTIKYW